MKQIMKPRILLSALLVWVHIAMLPVTIRAEGMTQQQADAILEELKGIRQLLQQQQTLLRRQNTTQRAPAADQNVTLKLVDTYALGSAKAPVTLVEFTDYQCPYCSRFHTTTFPQLKKNFIDTGKVRFISRDLPLHFHKNAFRAARASRCAGTVRGRWAWRSGGPAVGSLYYSTDHLGTVRALTDDSGNVVADLDHDSYGNPEVTVESVTQPYRFTARDFDSATGLYYYRARDYDPVTGRFLQEDPIWFDSGDMNVYRYTWNNPLMWRDPSGQSAIEYACMASFGTGAGASAGGTSALGAGGLFATVAKVLAATLGDAQRVQEIENEFQKVQTAVLATVALADLAASRMCGRAISNLLILTDFVAVDEVCRELVSVDGKKQRFFEK